MQISCFVLTNCQRAAPGGLLVLPSNTTNVCLVVREFDTHHDEIYLTLFANMQKKRGSTAENAKQRG